MPKTSTKYETRRALVALSALLGCFPPLASCSSNTGDGSGAGGAPQGAGGSGVGGSADSGVGGVVFMGSGGAPAACKQTGVPCADLTECCPGNLCNSGGPTPEWLGCQLECTQNGDCQSGCCLLFQGQTHGFCTSAKWCACGTSKSPCGPSLPKCCDTHVCLGVDPQGSSYACAQKCTQNTDCDTGCCAAVPSLGTSACLDKTYCP